MHDYAAHGRALGGYHQFSHGAPGTGPPGSPYRPGFLREMQFKGSFLIDVLRIILSAQQQCFLRKAARFSHTEYVRSLANMDLRHSAE